MRAFLIDPELRTITAIDFADDCGCDAIYRLVGGECFDTIYLSDELGTGFDTIYVSDDEPDDPQHWFRIDDDYDHDPIAGRGLVVGTNREGEDCDARIGLEELTARISFTRRTH